MQLEAREHLIRNVTVRHSIKEKKQHLFETQASEYSEWIEHLLGISGLKGNLIPSLKSGYVLCHLVAKIQPSLLSILGLKGFPKAPQQFNVFQMIEHLHWFLSACRTLLIDESDLFSVEELEKESNNLKVLRTLQCLREKYEELHPHKVKETQQHEGDHFQAPEKPQRPILNARVEEDLVELETELLEEAGSEGEGSNDDAFDSNSDGNISIDPTLLRKLETRAQKSRLGLSISKVHQAPLDENVWVPSPYPSEQSNSQELTKLVGQLQDELLLVEGQLQSERQQKEKFKLLAEQLQSQVNHLLQEKPSFRFKESVRAEIQEASSSSESLSSSESSGMTKIMVTPATPPLCSSPPPPSPPPAAAASRSAPASLSSSPLVPGPPSSPSSQHLSSRLKSKFEKITMSSSLGALKIPVLERRRSSTKLGSDSFGNQTPERAIFSPAIATSPSSSSPQSTEEKPETRQRPPSAGGVHSPKEHSPKPLNLWSHQPDVAPLLKTIEESERIRQEIIHEMFVTEEAYIEDLNILITHYMNPLVREVQKGGFITQAEVGTIFRNLKEIFQVNGSFLDDFHSLRGVEWPLIRSFGQFIREHAPSFECYAEYCATHFKSLAQLAQSEAKEPFRNYLKYCMALPECRRLDLQSFLVAPMQRITRYPLYLKNLLKHSKEGEPETLMISEALEEIQGIIEATNEYTRLRTNFDRVTEITSHLDSSKLKNFQEDIIARTGSEPRMLLHEGLLTEHKIKVTSLEKKPEKFECFLLTDMFLITKSAMKKGETFYALQYEPLLPSELDVRNIIGKNATLPDFSFTITSPHFGAVLFQAESEEEKTKWLAVLEAFVGKSPSHRSEKPLEASPRCLSPESQSSGGSNDMLTSPKSPPSQSPLLTDGTYKGRFYPSIQRGLTSLELTQEQQGPEVAHRRSKSEGATPSTRSPLLGDHLSLKKKFMTLSSSKAQLPPIALSQLQNPDFNGWLQIKGTESKKPFKPRWLVLKDFHLFIFASDDPEARLLDMLTMPGFKVVLVQFEGGGGFRLFHPSQPGFDFFTTEADLCEAWVEALTHASFAKKQEA